MRFFEMPPLSTLTSIVVQVVCRLVYGGLLGLLLCGLWQTLLTASPRQTLLQANLRLSAGESVMLGRRELAAPAADTQHLRVSRDAAGNWFLSNVSHTKALEVRRNDKDQLLRTALLFQGQHFTVAQDLWTVTAIEPVLTLTQVASGNVWMFDGAVLHRGTVSPACADATWQQTLRRLWNGAILPTLQRPVRLEWGGSVACDNHLPQASLVPGEVWIARDAANYTLRATAEAARRVCPGITPGLPCAPEGSLFDQSVPLKSVTKIVIGRTHFAASTNNDQLVLTVLDRSEWLPADARPPELAGQRLQWTLADENLWHWPVFIPPALTAALLVLAVTVLAAIAHVRRWGLTSASALGVAAAAVAALASFAAFLSGSAVGIGLCLALVCAAFVVVAFIPVHNVWVWGSFALMSLMVMAGLDVQLQLGLQAFDTGGWKYFQKTTTLASVAIFSCLTLAIFVRGVQSGNGRAQVWRMMVMEGALAVLAVVALLGLALQAVFGDEAGVFGIQPVELAKLALVMLSAHVLSLRLEWDHHKGWRRWTLWGRFILPVALFLALGAIALLLLRDYSPLVLMAVWLTGIMVTWSVASGRPGGALMALGLMGAGLALAMWAHGEGVQWLQVHGFYGDRFAVWVNPYLHPHSGEQFLRATQVLTQGGLNGNANAQAWRIPAVQDDMAPAFFAGRFGAKASCALLATQLAYIGCLLMLGWRAIEVAGPGDFRARWLARLVFFAAWGYAFLFAGHLALSWGTNFGFLPIMGQPMPLVSAGGSLLIMLLAPVHALWLIPLPGASQVRSTTKASKLPPAIVH